LPSTDPDRPVRGLVVDDHPIWRHGAAKDLAEAGYDVVGTAGDGSQALRAAGQAVFTPRLAGLVLGEYRRLSASAFRSIAAAGQRVAPAGKGITPVTPVLTGREAEILRLVAKGLTYPQIATRLVLSTRTVQNHIQNTLSKLQLHNKAELVRYALEQGVD
jgi:DNA-binding NarL/FixJ family response regulator